jgi:cytidylate kinase
VTARERPIVAIDGPAGAGKSTVARKLAEALGFVLVDTGAMYRVVAIAAKNAGIAWTDGEGVGKLADALVARGALSFERDPEAGVRVRLDGVDVSDAIRTPDIGMGASHVSAFKPVRDALLELQRQAGRAGGVVLEGRDIGTVVFPDATLKIFLDADQSERVRRRAEQLGLADPSPVLEQIAQRDRRDTGRAEAPLAQAPDAVYLDSTGLSIDQVADAILKLIRARVTNGKAHD